jgi:hypothetical protein
MLVASPKQARAAQTELVSLFANRRARVRHDGRGHGT